MRVALIPRAHKLLAIALAVVIGAILIWGTVGSIPTKVLGNGIIHPSGQQLYPVQGIMGGRVGEIAVTIGDEVQAGQDVVVILQPDLDEKILLVRRTLEDTQKDVERQEARQEDVLKAREESTAALVESLSTALSRARSRRDSVERELGGEDGERSGEQGRHDAEQRFLSISERITGLEIQLARAKADLVEYRARSADSLVRANDKVESLKRELEELEVHRDHARHLRAPVDGIIEEIHAGVGEVVQPSETLLTMASADDGFEVLAFLETADGHLVSLGSAVHVVPTSVRKQEFGTMRGEVTFLSEEPVSAAQVNALLRNPQLTRDLTGDRSLYLSRIKLFESSAGDSGFEWWTGHGPPFPVTVGTLARVEIVVQERAPLIVLIPGLREIFGL